MSNKKKQTAPKWKVLARQSVKWESFTMTELKNWIGKYIPANTPDDEVRLSFDVTEEWGYYDDHYTQAEMLLEILE